MTIEIGFGSECKKCGYSVGVLIGDQICPNCKSPLGAMPEARAPKMTAHFVCPKCSYRVGMLMGDPICPRCRTRLPD